MSWLDELDNKIINIGDYNYKFKKYPLYFVISTTSEEENIDTELKDKFLSNSYRTWYNNYICIFYDNEKNDIVLRIFYKDSSGEVFRIFIKHIDNDIEHILKLYPNLERINDMPPK